MTFDDVQAVRNDVLNWMRSQLPQHCLLGYELEGGQQSPNPWQAAGVYCAIAGQGRLVLELLFTPARGRSLLRVYREDSQAVLAAVVMDHPNVNGARSAAKSFLAAVRGQELLDLGRERQKLRDLHLSADVESLLHPVPPPVPPELR